MAETEIVKDSGGQAAPDTGGKTKPKTKRKSKKKTDQISFEECQLKLARLFNGICTIFKIDKKYKESDFKEEAKDLSRLAAKYEPVETFLVILDPLFLLLGLVNKGTDIFNELRNRKPKKVKQGEPGQQAQGTNQDHQGVANTDRGGAVEQLTPGIN